MAVLAKPAEPHNTWIPYGGAFLALLSFALLHEIGVGIVSAEDKPSDLETIRAAVDFYAQTLKTLEGKYRRTMTAGPNYPAAPTGLVMRNFRDDATFSADIVNHKVYRNRFNAFDYLGKSGGTIEIHSHFIDAFDGRISYHLLHTHTKSPVEMTVPVDSPNQLNIFQKDDTANDYLPQDFAGLRLPAGIESLAALLRQPGIKLDGHEKVDDVMCARLGAEFPNEMTATVWLDPQHDFLPKRFEVRDVVAESRKSRVLHRFDIVEFREYPDLGGERARWFPARATATSFIDVHHAFEITDLMLNPAVPPERFVVDTGTLPDGVQVNDETKQPRQASYTGGRRDLWVERKALIDDEDKRIEELLVITPPGAMGITANSEAEPVVAVQADGAAWLGWLIGGISVLLIVVGGLVIVRGNRRPG